MVPGLGPLPRVVPYADRPRVRHPHLSDQQRTTIQGLVSRLRDMENEVESYGGAVPPTTGQMFNNRLTESQSSLSEIESELQQST